MQMRCNQADHENQSIIGVCIDITCPNLSPYCNFCLPLHAKHLHMLTPLDLINEWISERILQVHNVYNSVQDLKVPFENLLNQFSPYCNFNIDQIPKLGLSEIDKLVKDLGSIQECEKILFRQLNQSIQQIKQIVFEILKTIKDQSNIYKNDNTQIPSNMAQYIIEQPKNLNKLKPNISPIAYEIMNKHSIKQKEFCFAIALNKDRSILAAGCDKSIKIYKFSQGMFKQIQLLNQHQEQVSTLNFMKKTNQLISGDCIGTILIWPSNNNNEWICSQTLQHNGQINCLIINNNEDIIISSSNDKTIKFWTKQNEWICQQTIRDYQSCVYQLSLNEKQNKVISYGYDKLILVIENSQQYKQWMVIQKIQVDCFGIRLCFINDNLFTFQPYKGNQMYIYEMNTVCKQFAQTQHVTVNEGEEGYALFSQQYIKSKQLLVSKHDKYINFIKMTDDNHFKVEQTIQFGSNMLFGYMSDDGEYLIIWNNLSKEISIRKSILE
ncbi:unnamed protein product [Paramecium octaurelia]|uniref:Uncharacterized protein n=1 Tax=Paramecium octaurelia TaxID=43137 RepID=A0A8S1UIS7_PAROT|nr:unnamed protein product [Paramecium octaurelia]